MLQICLHVMMKHLPGLSAALAACMLAAAAGSLPAQIPPREPPQEAFPGALVIPQWSRDLEKQQQAFEDVIVSDDELLPPPPADGRAETMLRVLANVQPGSRLPWPALRPQVVRYVNAELVLQGLPWQVRLQLNAAPEDAQAVRDAVLAEGGPGPALQQALAAGTLGEIIKALAATLDAEVVPRAEGRVLLALRRSHRQLWRLQGKIPATEVMRAEFADILAPPGSAPNAIPLPEGRAPRFSDRLEDVAALDPAAAERLRTLRQQLKAAALAGPAARLPVPATLPQVLRLVNAEFARLRLPYSICLDLEPPDGMDAGRWLARHLYRKAMSSDRIEAPLLSGHLEFLLHGLDNLNCVLAPPDESGRLLLRFADACAPPYGDEPKEITDLKDQLETKKFLP